MLEGLPPNGASHMLRLVATETNARAIIAIVVETFEPAETAASAFMAPAGTNWAVEVFFAHAPDEARVRALIEAATDAATAAAAQFSHIAQQDWVSASVAALPPVRAGRFLIHGSHARSRAAANDIAIEIDAAMAFGTGHHGTTLGEDEQWLSTLTDFLEPDNRDIIRAEAATAIA
ncbi:MAG: 50S ribosomal protein L11 methyltransferase, partial [Methylocystis sp.]|nr:50S ribosomal protein L11 methyltransferase [Methylocystis sp.]